ncbi:MAG TPA: TrbC/VirB2 family protein [Gammaproteobacteria bacterium]|nr:TrbC/VirB2 family protein [Gammaproteobacteria bacterium]
MWIFLSLLIYSKASFAFAEDDAIYSALVNITDWLTDDIGLVAGTLAIVGAGFACMSGRIPYLFLRSILIGIGLIYGAAFIAQKITGA